MQTEGSTYMKPKGNLAMGNASRSEKSKCFSALVAAFLLQCAVFADTVTIDPGDGVATNVQHRITGATDVVVNSGVAGGGIVTLNPYNTYTGSTTLGCGTLVATALGGGSGSSLGLTSGLALGAGTFRYAGADGASFAAPIVSIVSSTTATVLDIEDDLSISGGYTQTAGAVVKTGAGTLTLAEGDNLFNASTLTSPASNSITVANTVVPLNLNANGDAPTQGYAGFTVAEGTFRIAGGRNALGANCYAQVGVQGTDAKEATLEIAGGENWIANHLVVCPPRNVEDSRAGIRISGGTTTIGNGKSMYLGCANEVRNGGYAPLGEYEAFFEMTGGTLSAPSSDSNFLIGLAGKGKINVDIAGGTVAFGKNLGFGNGDAAGRATNDVTFTIRDGGTVAASNSMYRAATPVQESVYRINLLDGGKLSTKNVYVSYPNDQSDPDENEMHIFMDGGILEALAHSADYAILPKAFAKDDVRIGSKGATFLYSSSTTTVVVRITANLVATNSVPGMEPKGVTFAKGGAKPACFRISAPGAWAGPTVIGEDTTLDLYSNESALPATSDVTVDGALAISRSGTVAVGRSLTVNGSVKMYTGATLTLDGPISGDGKMLLYSNTGLTSNSWTDGNTYPIVTVPLSAKSSLEAFAKNCRAGVNPGNGKCILEFNVTDDGEKATLSMKYITSPESSMYTDDGITFDGEASHSIARLLLDGGYEYPNSVGLQVRSFTLNGGDVTIFNDATADNMIVKVGHLAKESEKSGLYESKLTINGGTFHMPGDLQINPDQGCTNKTGYATVLVNGGKLEIAGDFHPNRRPTASAIGNTVTLNGGTISCNTLLCSSATGIGTYHPATITLNGGLFCAAQLVDLCYREEAKNAGAGSLLYLNSSATLRAPGIRPTQSGTGAGKVYFNGGTLQVALTSGIDSYVENCEAVYVGNGGAVFDMTLNKDWLNKNKYINLKQSFLHDPDCTGEDGGVTIFGEGLVVCGSGFANSTFTGPVVVRDNGNFMAYHTALTGHDLVAKPTCIFRQYEKDQVLTLDNLTLGEPGAFDSVTIKAYRHGALSLPMAKVENALNVCSPVLVGVTDSWESAPTLDNNGVYTTLVYKAENSSVDVSLFKGYPTDGKKATFAIVDSAYDGYKAVVMTVATGEDAGALAAYSKVDDEWTFSPAVGGLNRLLSAPSGTSAVFDGDSLDDFDGILYVNAEQNEANRGLSGAVTFGADSFDGFGGILYPRSGTVTIPSLAWMTDASQLRLGFGTVKYTGTGETIPGFTARPGISYYSSNLCVDNDLTILSASQIGNGQFMKSGDGTLHLKGEGSFTFGSNHTRDYTTVSVEANHLCANGDTATNAIANLAVGAGKVSIGELGGPSDIPSVQVLSRAVVGLPSGGDHDSELEINSGTLSLSSGSLFVGYYCGTNTVIHPRLTVNGGTVAVPGNLYTAHSYVDGTDWRDQTCSPEITVNGGEVNVAGSVLMNNGFATSAVATDAKTASTFTLNGGAVTVQNEFSLANKNGSSNRTPDGFLFLNGGVLDVKGTINVSKCAKTAVELWLNDGGLLKAGNITASQPGGTFYFNGGTFMPYGSTATLAADDKIVFSVSTNGVVIDTSSVAGGTYTIAASLKHDSALGDALDGGLVKKGAGTLALSGANTFTGPAIVEEGVLQALSDTALPSVTEVRYGTALDLDGASRMVGGLAGDGVVQNGTLVLAGPIVAGKGVPFLDCNLETAKGAAIDFGRTEANPVRLGKTFLVAQIAEERTVGNLQFKALNSGLDKCVLRVTVADGNVYVTTGMRGLILVAR